MSSLPLEVLNWLHSVLLGEYQDVNRTYSDIAHTLAAYRSLRPTTAVYTSEDGQSSLMLHISGTIPASFRGNMYYFPVSLWIPKSYPREAPISFVTPTPEMIVRPGQHVSGEGRIYHPYLANWGPANSNVTELIKLLQDIFARQPPVMARRRQQPSDPRPPPAPTQPPVPPRKPDEPPQVPPRPDLDQSPPTTRNTSQPPVNSRYSMPPPLPHEEQQRPPSTINNQQAPFSPATPTSPQVAVWVNEQAQHLRLQHGASLPGPSRSPLNPSYHQQSQTYPPNYSYQQQQGPPYTQPIPHQSTSQAQNSQQQVPHPQSHHPQPPPDLLTSPFDPPLPNLTPLPAPPIPPNPEKDALLSTLSHALTSQLHASISNNQSAITPLRAQHTALQTAHAKLSAEQSALSHLAAAIAQNEATLHAAMREADSVIARAKDMPVPPVDEVLVPPTVLGQQMYELVAEEKACAEAREVLGRALDRGRVGIESWVKATRGLAREEFQKKWLVRKAATGMGLIGAEEGRGVGNGEGTWS